MKKRLLALLMAVCMVISMLPVSVLAEEMGGEPTSVTPAEPAPAEPAPAEPTPAEPTPAEPTPAEPTPTEPTPTEPTPTEATPTEATPTEATPTEPTPTEPTPTEATPTEPTPTEATPTEPTPTESTPTEPTPTEPTQAQIVQGMIDALPGEVTAENAASVIAQLEAIDEAKLPLGDDFFALDITRYAAAIAGLEALEGTPGAQEPQPLGGEYVIPAGTSANLDDIDGEIINYGTITGGTTDFYVANYGTIQDGNFHFEVDNFNDILGGTFYCAVYNQRGSIHSGTFTEYVLNYVGASVSGGDFSGSFDGIYTVTFDSKGGSTVPAQRRANAPATKPADPTRTDTNGGTYKFLGWYNGGTEYTFTADEKITSDITLTAKWEYIIPTGVSVNLDDVDTSNITQITNNGTIVNAYTVIPVTNNGTIQDGDFFGAVTNKGTIQNGGFHVYATNSGTIQNGVFAGITNKAGGTIQGAEIVRTLTNENGGIVSGGNLEGTTLSGVYTVTFDAKGGSAVPTQYRANAPATEPADPTRTDSNGGTYKFLGWYNGDTEYTFTADEKITSDITLTARWEYVILAGVSVSLADVDTSNVTQITNNGTILDGLATVPVTNNGTIQDGTFDEPVTNNGTIQNGYFSGSVTNNPTGTVAGGKFYQSTIGIYTVTFDSKGGSVVYTQYRANAPATEPNTTRKSSFGGEYKLLGWYNGDTKYNFTENVTSNITLTAKWEYVIPAGESVDLGNIDLTYVTQITNNGTITGGFTNIPVANNGTIQDGVFNGAVTNNGTIESGYFGSEVTNHPSTGIVTGGTFAGGFSGIYIVTFDAAGGDFPPATQYRANAPVTEPDDPSNGSQKFYGWYVKTASGYEPYDFTTKVTADITLYANLNCILGHVGGTATCAAKAICENCGQGYGELDSSNHNYGALVPAQAAVHTKTELKPSVDAHYLCACGRYFDENKVETSLEALTGETPEHSGTDDGDCTTAVVCECGLVLTPARAGHNWITHDGKCANPECNVVCDSTTDADGDHLCDICLKTLTPCPSGTYKEYVPEYYDDGKTCNMLRHAVYTRCSVCNAQQDYGLESHHWQNGVCSDCKLVCHHENTITTEGYIIDPVTGEIDLTKHYTSTICDTCGELLSEANVPHTWVDGKCKLCGITCDHSKNTNHATCGHAASCSVCGVELEEALLHWFSEWKPCSDGFHAAYCIRKGCDGTAGMPCEWFDLTFTTAEEAEMTVSICPVCGAVRHEDALFEAIKDATVKANEKWLPRGELIVRGMEAPYGECLFAFTVGYEYSGWLEEFLGEVTVTVPLEIEGDFRLVYVDMEEKTEEQILTDVEFTYEDGTLTFETENQGIYLILPVSE